MRLYIWFIGLCISGLAACGSAPTSPPAGDDGRLQVVTTIGQVADIVENVGGEHVAVSSLMGPGTDPHLYLASAGDVERLAQADIIFYNGLFLEAQMEDVLEQLAQTQNVVAVSSGVDPARLLPSPNYANEFDPHIWFDVTLWADAVRTVRATLVAADPVHEEDYNTNTAAYLAQLEQLHQYVLSQAVRLPDEQRVLITAHDAFNYFGRAYGFEVLGLQGISTAAEAGAGDVQALVDFIVERQIPAIFVESSVPVRNIEAVQAGVAARGFEVTIGGQLFSDAMGDRGTPAGTYIGMVTHNIDTIVTALSGGQ